MNQTKNGKAFEYAILSEFNEKLEQRTSVEIIKNNAYNTAKAFFDSCTELEKGDFLLYASFAINFLIDIEPKLANSFEKNDILQLEILTDDKGQTGDVRDVVAIRLLQKWEVGISAKNNHNAVKHSRLSNTIDFGNKWLGLNASQVYFSEIKPIFDSLNKIRVDSNQTATWNSLGDYHASIYVPILNAFKKELLNLYQQAPKQVASNLVEYLIGNKDFYKVIKSKNKLEILAYNLHGTLNLPFKDTQPKRKTPKIELPSKIIDISFKEKSDTTLIVTLNNNWKLSFRIHNASSRIEASLKFDITLLSAPETLISNTLTIKDN